MFEARVVPIRGLDHPLTGRGAYKLYAGAAEVDARIRFFVRGGVESREGAFARIRVSAPLALEVHDRFVIREAGRRATVAGGVVLDVDPPLRPGPQPERRLAARERASREELPAHLVRERGTVRARDLLPLTGVAPATIAGAVRVGGWWVSEEVHRRVAEEVERALGEFHREHPLRAGAELALGRAAAAGALARAGRTQDPGLVDAVLDELDRRGVIARTGSEVRLASHRVALEDRQDEVDRLVAAVASAEPTPPTVSELAAAGFSREVVEAAGRAGVLVRISPELVMTPELVSRAEDILREEGTAGVTVSAFRERLGTSRKYALPLLEWFDQRGVTRRRGDLRVLREPR
jgi:selenocysteine-specific elongation factor